MVSSILWRVQYKHETPNQSLKLKTLNVVSSVLWRVQYKHETPNQSLKLKTLNVVSSVLWRVQYKDETPNQSLKLKTLNVVSSVLSRAQCKHETPNQSLKLKTLSLWDEFFFQRGGNMKFSTSKSNSWPGYDSDTIDHRELTCSLWTARDRIIMRNSSSGLSKRSHSSRYWHRIRACSVGIG